MFYFIQQPSTHDVLSTKGPPFPWSDNLFLQPVIPDDPLLQLDFDDNDDEETRERMEAISLVNNSGRGEDPVMDELIKKQVIVVVVVIYGCYSNGCTINLL